MSIWTTLKNAIDNEYDRRIKAASNVREYAIGGHGHAHDEHDEAQDHPELRENQEGDSHAAFGTETEPAAVGTAAHPTGH
jgi:hypothetical protein